MGTTLVPFFAFLLSVSWICATFFVEPARSWWMRPREGPRRFTLPAAVVGFSVVLACVGAIDGHVVASPLPATPAPAAAPPRIA